jgi:hypothetical protein
VEKAPNRASVASNPPEGCVNPMDFIPLIPQVMSIDKKKEGGESFGGIIIQKVDENGAISDVEL